MLVAERVADRADPLAHAQRVGVAERRLGQPVAPIDLTSATSVAGSMPTTSRPQRAAVGQRHRDPIGALDDVIVGQDVAVGVDDEAAAGALTRHVVVARPASVGSSGPDAVPRLVTAARRGVDVHDGRVDPLGDVGEVDAPAAARAPAGAPTGRGASRGALDTTGGWPTPPATMTPTRNATADESTTVSSVKRRMSQLPVIGCKSAGRARC